MDITLSLQVILQLLGVGVTAFMVGLLFFIDKGIRSKSLFLKLFFFLLVLAQLIVFKEQHDILILGEDLFRLEKMISLFVLIGSILSVFPVLFLYVQDLMNRQNKALVLKSILPGVFFTFLFTIETAYIIFKIPTSILLIGKSVIILVVATVFTIKTFKASRRFNSSLEQDLSFTEGLDIKWVRFLNLFVVLFLLGFILDSLSAYAVFTPIFFLITVIVLGLVSVKNFIQIQALTNQMHLVNTEVIVEEKDKSNEERIEEEELALETNNNNL